MGLSNVEVIRDQYAATNERDWQRVMSHYAEDVVLVIHGEGIRSGTCEGREALGRWFGEWFSTFDRDARFEIREINEREDGSVLVLADHHARGRGSGVEVQGAVAWLYGFREGKIVRLEGNAGMPGNTGLEGCQSTTRWARCAVNRRNHRSSRNVEADGRADPRDVRVVQP